jgi:hypothetical protein
VAVRLGWPRAHVEEVATDASVKEVMAVLVEATDIEREEWRRRRWTCGAVMCRASSESGFEGNEGAGDDPCGSRSQARDEG